MACIVLRRRKIDVLVFVGTTNLFDEPGNKEGTLGSAFQAKPSSAEPKNSNQAEAYSHDKPGWGRNQRLRS